MGKTLPSVYTCREGEQKAGVRRKFHFVGQCHLLMRADLECCIKEEGPKARSGEVCLPGRELSWWGMGQEQESGKRLSFCPLRCKLTPSLSTHSLKAPKCPALAQGERNLRLVQWARHCNPDAIWEQPEICRLLDSFLCVINHHALFGREISSMACTE